MSKVLCPGSFDPITVGHVDIIDRARLIFGEVLVAVGRNSTKSYLFDFETRVRLAEESLAGRDGVEVAGFEGLLVEFAKERGVIAVVKGLRFGADFDYELQMAHLNRSLTGLETVLLPAAAQHATLSSTMLREVARLGGDVSAYVTPVVNQAIKDLVAPPAGRR